MPVSCATAGEQICESVLTGAEASESLDRETCFLGFGVLVWLLGLSRTDLAGAGPALCSQASCSHL